MKVSRFLRASSVPFMTAALAFFGAICGTYLAAKLEQSNWEARFNLEQRRAVLDKRVELMDKMAVLFSRTPVVEGLSANIEGSIDLLRIERDCLKLGVPAERCRSSGDLSVVERSAKERNALQSEMSSTFILTSIYFGPRTKEALRAMSGDPWKASDLQRQKLIDAMGKELHYFEVDL